MDCIEGMRLFPDAHFDSIVTDPPYHLTTGKKGGSGEASVNLDSPYGRARIGTGFMGMKWDGGDIAQSVEMWTEALRVLKPGGHLLAFSGSRTYHRMVCAIEDAGFEIRDQIMWVYGSGFPKSLDVSKAIDKARTEDIEPLRVICRALRAAMDARGFKSRDMVQHFGDCNPRLVDHWAARDTDSQPSMPTWGQWETLRGLFPELAALDAEAWHLNGRKGAPGDAWQTAEVIGEHTGEVAGLGGGRFSAVDKTIREPSDAARQWQGWGTALKPAHEPIVVARKPLIGTVAANVLAHGTGAINVDGCRVEGIVTTNPQRRGVGNISTSGHAGQADTGVERISDVGRWPANLIHDGSDEVIAAFPQAPGQMADASTSDTQRAGQNVYGTMRRGSGGAAARVELDKSAARFFQTCESRYDDDLWQDLNLPSSDAATADVNLHQLRQAVFSALAVVAKKALPAALSWGVSLSTEPITAATPMQLRRLAMALTRTILSIDSAYWLEPERARLSLSLNPVQSVVQPTPIDTTMITLSHWLSDGSAEPVTFNITPTSWAVGAKDCAPSWAAEGARFKYCAKASKSDRNEGLDSFPLKPSGMVSNTSGQHMTRRDGGAPGPSANNHPTVKPTALMRYLCRLVTPPGGTVLDPFTGSGSTGKAAALEGFGFIGFELSAEYAAIATARIMEARK